MRFDKFFNNRTTKMNTSGLAGHDGVVKSGSGGHKQTFAKRQVIEQNRQHVKGYHMSNLQGTHITGIRRNASTPSQQASGRRIDIVRPPARPSTPRSSQLRGPGYHFQEPPSRQRPN